jgi:serine/threonine protein kinase
MEPKSIDRIFWDAAQIASAGERDAYLDRACAEDVELRQRVEELLQVRSKAGSFLEAPAPHLVATVGERPLSEGPGTVIGPHKLLEQIGEGGFGVVFMAEQQEPIRRKVAVKVIEPGMDSKQVIARFEAERQALALMDHPNIAKIIDAGQTASGRPYFVMELVKGMPITDYCDQGQLTPRERLELFISVCQAVQHAHQKGIIHRDLKPSNILVTLHDGSPVVKVIDFGIAKALGQQLTDKTLFTSFAQLIGTPLYMSPEQAALSGQDVDTRSDIYSLGVLLYELLTGTTPFAKERFQEAGYDEIRRIIREEEPPKPSTRINTLGQAATTLSTQRKSDPKQLCRLFRGELDWIVMKCLEKDRNRRYETASALGVDAHRYLRDEPVFAGPPSVWYRLGKFTRRNKVGLAIVGLILLLFVSLGGGAGWMVRDRSARLAVTEQKVDLALRDATTLQGQAKWPEALEAVKRAEGILAGGGKDELRQRAQELRNDLEMVLRLEDIWFPRPVEGTEGDLDHVGIDAAYAKAFRDYGIDATALEPTEAAEQVRDRTIWLELTAALDHWVKVRAGFPKEAHQGDDAIRKRLLAVARAADRDAWRNQVRDALEQGQSEKLRELSASPAIANQPVQALSLLGGALDSAGAGKEAVAVLRLAQQRYPDDFEIDFQLAWALDHGQTPASPAEEVIRFYTVARALRPRNFPVHMILAGKLRAHGQMDEAIAVYRWAIALKPDDVTARGLLVQGLLAQGELDVANAEARQLIARAPGQSVAHQTWGNVLRAQGNLDEAIAELQLAVTLARSLQTVGDLNEALMDKEDLDGAIALWEQIVQREGKQSPKWASQAYWRIGVAQQRKGEFALALAAFREAAACLPATDKDQRVFTQCTQVAEQQLKRDGKLPAVLRGQEKPANTAEQLEYAQICKYKRLYHGAARLYAAAFAADRQPVRRYGFAAAGAAAMASMGHGADTGELDQAGRAAWRRQALDWLRAYVAARIEGLDKSEPERAASRGGLIAVKRDRELAGLRDAAALAALPEAEREAWNRFWADVDTALARGQAAVPAQQRPGTR